MKTVMAKKEISIRDKIRSAIDIYKAYNNKGWTDAKNIVFHHNRLRGYLEQYVAVSIERANILEIGCGQIPVQVALFHAEGAKIVGIDIDMPTYKMTIPIFWRIIQINGLERAMKSLARHVLFDRKFFRNLSKEFGTHIIFNDIDVRLMDATKMAFESDTFDFIYSNVVFQHIDNIEGAVRELNRVLKPSGIAAINIHLFPSLSGGICLDWLYPEKSPSKIVPPWDHLRKSKYPANIHLNKMTINQYRKIFNAYTNIVEEQTVVEGERFLTGELEDELTAKGYTREDLLTRTVLFLVRKKL